MNYSIVQQNSRSNASETYLCNVTQCSQYKKSHESSLNFQNAKYNNERKSVYGNDIITAFYRMTESAFSIVYYANAVEKRHFQYPSSVARRATHTSLMRARAQNSFENGARALSPLSVSLTFHEVDPVFVPLVIPVQLCIAAVPAKMYVEWRVPVPAATMAQLSFTEKKPGGRDSVLFLEMQYI